MPHVPCSSFLHFLHLQTDLALDELLSQIEIYFFQLPVKAERLNHLNIGYITYQCTYLVICRHVFLTYTVLLCAIVNRNCNMDVSLYYKFFLLLMKKLLFNWHTQDNREWWCSVVQDSVMASHRQFWNENHFSFSYDGVGSYIDLFPCHMAAVSRRGCAEECSWLGCKLDSNSIWLQSQFFM